MDIVNGPFSKTSTVDSYATDVLPNTKVMDVEEYEGRLSSVSKHLLSDNIYVSLFSLFLRCSGWRE